MEKAIKKAIKGGYNGVALPNNQWIGIQVIIKEYYAWILLDPLFWQALGKVEGWIDDVDNEYGLTPIVICEWKENWHKFIDHLVNGGNIDKFFDKLLTQS